jgi:hypothetical protein
MPVFGVRVSPLGRKTFVLQYKIRGIGKDGKDVEVAETLGTADKVTLEAAREQGHFPGPELAFIPCARAKRKPRPSRQSGQRMRSRSNGLATGI